MFLIFKKKLKKIANRSFVIEESFDTPTDVACSDGECFEVLVGRAQVSSCILASNDRLGSHCTDGIEITGRPSC